MHDSISKYVKVLNTDSDYISFICLSKNLHQCDQNNIVASVHRSPRQPRCFHQDKFELFEQDVTSLCSQCDYFFMIGDFIAQIGNLEP